MLFETMLVVRGWVVHLEEHFARMRRSADALGYPPLDLACFRDVVRPVILSRGDDEGSRNARPSHSEILRSAQDDGGGSVARAVRCTYGGDGTLRAEPIAIPAATLDRRHDARAITLVPSIARELPEHKLLEHYDVAREALRFALANGANEALFVSSGAAGFQPSDSVDPGVLEGTATNVFAIRSDTLITAAAGVLPGVVRAWTIARAIQLGLAIEYRPPVAEELREGAFLTGSLTMLAPLRMLDGRPCRAPGAPFDELARLYREELTRQNAPRE